jgi:hypothetical protein
MLLLTCDACAVAIQQQQQHTLLCEMCKDRQSHVITVRAVLDGPPPPPSPPSVVNPRALLFSLIFPRSLGCEVALQQLPLPALQQPKQQFRKSSIGKAAIAPASHGGGGGGSNAMDWGVTALALMDAALDRCKALR